MILDVLAAASLLLSASGRLPNPPQVPAEVTMEPQVRKSQRQVVRQHHDVTVKVNNCSPSILPFSEGRACDGIATYLS